MLYWRKDEHNRSRSRFQKFCPDDRKQRLILSRLSAAAVSHVEYAGFAQLCVGSIWGGVSRSEPHHYQQLSTKVLTDFPHTFVQAR